MSWAAIVVAATAAAATNDRDSRREHAAPVRGADAPTRGAAAEDDRRVLRPCQSRRGCGLPKKWGTGHINASLERDATRDGRADRPRGRGGRDAGTPGRTPGGEPSRRRPSVAVFLHVGRDRAFAPLETCLERVVAAARAVTKRG